MRLDVEDVLAGEFGRFFSILLFVLSACWVGSMIGGLAWFFGTWDLGPYAGGFGFRVGGPVVGSSVAGQ